MRDARIEVIPGRHAPFVDDAERCGALINDLVRGRAAPPRHVSEARGPQNAKFQKYCPWLSSTVQICTRSWTRRGGACPCNSPASG